MARDLYRYRFSTENLTPETGPVQTPVFMHVANPLSQFADPPCSLHIWTPMEQETGRFWADAEEAAKSMIPAAIRVLFTVEHLPISKTLPQPGRVCLGRVVPDLGKSVPNELKALSNMVVMADADADRKSVRAEAPREGVDFLANQWDGAGGA